MVRGTVADPGSKTATKERGEKNCCPTFFCSHKYHKIENLFIFELVKKNIWGNLQRIIELFTQKLSFYPKKLSLSSQKYSFGFRDQEKTYSGSRIQRSKGTGSRIPDSDPQHWREG
jgi:hypothetical protein